MTSIGAHSSSLLLEGPYHYLWSHALSQNQDEAKKNFTRKVTSIGAHPSSLLLQGLHQDLEFVEGKSLD